MHVTLFPIFIHMIMCISTFFGYTSPLYDKKRRRNKNLKNEKKTRRIKNWKKKEKKKQNGIPFFTIFLKKMNRRSLFPSSNMWSWYKKGKYHYQNRVFTISQWKYIYIQKAGALDYKLHIAFYSYGISKAVPSPFGWVSSSTHSGHNFRPVKIGLAAFFYSKDSGYVRSNSYDSCSQNVWLFVKVRKRELFFLLLLSNIIIIIIVFVV